MIAPMKKCILLLIVFALLFFTEGTVFAARDTFRSVDSGTVEVKWDNTHLVDINLSFQGSKAICGACVIAKPGTTKITGTAVLERKNKDGTYTEVKTWKDLYSDDYIMIFDGVCYISTGYTYRLKITATVYRNGTSETISGDYEAYAS